MTPETRSLLRAAAVGDSERVTSLLADGTEVNCVSPAGQTPLMLAAGFGHAEIVRILLDAGAYTGAIDELGFRAIDWAINFPKVINMIRETQSSTVDDSNGQPKSTSQIAEHRFPTPHKPTFESNEGKVTLGGLAGAILRDRAAKSAILSDEHRDEIPPPAPPPIAVVDNAVGSVPVEPLELNEVDSLVNPRLQSVPNEIEPLSEDQVIYGDEPVQSRGEPLVETELPGTEYVAKNDVRENVGYPEEAASIPSVEPSPAVERAAPTNQVVEDRFDDEEEIDHADVDPTIEDGLTDLDEPITSKSAKPPVEYPFDREELFERLPDSEDDDTFSRAGAMASDDTPSKVPRPGPRREAFQSLGLSEPPPARVSKVEVSVPTFKTMQSSSTRTLIWILVILFLGGGAYAGYRLSNYFLNANSNNPPQTITPKSEPQPQPSLGPVKAAPVVTGELAGMELFVPDAEYPANAAPQSGAVVVHVRVNQKGIVLSAEATEGPEKLRSAAETAGKLAAFSPEKMRGLGQVVGGTITYTFVAPAASTNTSAATGSSSTETENPSPKVGGPLAGTEVNVPQPDYPATAKAKNLTGTVTIVVRVNRTGHVVSWRTVDGDDLLRQAALKAAKQATFDPAKLPGTGDIVGTITFTFPNR